MSKYGERKFTIKYEKMDKFIASCIFWVLLLIVIYGYNVENRWTGLTTDTPGLKTLWDWFELLFIPAVLAFGALLFRRGEAEAQRKRSEENANLERDLEDQRAQDTAWEAYIDRISDLLLAKGLANSRPKSPVQELATTRTLAILRRLKDSDRRNHVLKFLKDARLLGSPPTLGLNLFGTGKEKEGVALLRNANLRKTDLRDAYLFHADLVNSDLYRANCSGADLSFADLSDAKLYKANLCGAFMRMAHLFKANLNDATLDGADLIGARLDGAEMKGTTLKGAYLARTNLCGVKELTCEQLREANNWDSSYRDEDLACGASIPDSRTSDDQTK